MYTELIKQAGGEFKTIRTFWVSTHPMQDTMHTHFNAVGILCVLHTGRCYPWRPRQLKAQGA